MHEDSTPTQLTAALSRGRDAYRRRAWSEGCAQLSAADREAPLEAEDLERLAIAATLLGRSAESEDAWARAHQQLLQRGHPERAARAALLLALDLIERNEQARAGGWIARARRLLGDDRRDCAEQGYLLVHDALRSLSEGDREAASNTLSHAAEIGDRFGDRDLVALARHVQGRVLIWSGRAAEGVVLLDEAMVAVTTGEVSPIVAGGVYCSVISGCQEIFDWRRAQEWTAALDRWCADQPDLVLYRGLCLLHRAEILQLRGDWPNALLEAVRARDRLSDPPGQAGIGSAFCRVAELHRLRGELAEAEEAYRQAGLHGRRTQPGVALLRLAQGETDVALASHPAGTRRDPRAADPARPAGRVRGVALAADQVVVARAAADELAAIAADLGAPYLRRLSGTASGAVRLVEGDARGALSSLREAEAIFSNWMLLTKQPGSGCWSAARAASWETSGRRGWSSTLPPPSFAQLGAVPDLERLGGLRRAGGAQASRKAHTAGGRGAPPDRRWQDQPGHRRSASDQREDRGPPCEQHLRQAGSLQPFGSHRVCLPACAGAVEAGLIRADNNAYIEVPTLLPFPICDVLPMRAWLGSSRLSRQLNRSER